VESVAREVAHAVVEARAEVAEDRVARQRVGIAQRLSYSRPKVLSLPASQVSVALPSPSMVCERNSENVEVVSAASAVVEVLVVA
jgi:hypothetical protein